MSNEDLIAGVLAALRLRGGEWLPLAGAEPHVSFSAVADRIAELGERPRFERAVGGRFPALDAALEKLEQAGLVKVAGSFATTLRLMRTERAEELLAGFSHDRRVLVDDLAERLDVAVWGAQPA